MKHHTFEEVVELIDKNPEKKNELTALRTWGDPPKEDSILIAEALLGIKFPEDYRHFILKWGYIESGIPYEIYGIGTKLTDKLITSWLIRDTLEARLPAESPYNGTNLPLYYTVIYVDEDFYHCIDTRDPDGKVIAWDYFNACFDSVLADSFVDYFYDQINDDLY